MKTAELPIRSAADLARETLVGVEWIVDAVGCSAECLRDLDCVRGLCESILSDLDLHVVGEGHWHRFAGAGGVTGLYLLSESHLACHTYPEHELATFNLYCCRPRAIWPWQSQLRTRLKAREVAIRSVERGGVSLGSEGRP